MSLVRTAKAPHKHSNGQWRLQTISYSPCEQQVVKLNMATTGQVLFNPWILRFGIGDGLVAGALSYTVNDPVFSLAPGYKHVGVKTLHGKFGGYTSLREFFGFAELQIESACGVSQIKKKKLILEKSSKSNVCVVFLEVMNFLVCMFIGGLNQRRLAGAVGLGVGM